MKLIDVIVYSFALYIGILLTEYAMSTPGTQLPQMLVGAALIGMFAGTALRGGTE